MTKRAPKRLLFALFRNFLEIAVTWPLPVVMLRVRAQTLHRNSRLGGEGVNQTHCLWVHKKGDINPPPAPLGFSLLLLFPLIICTWLKRFPGAA